jgi:hypothetical protein
MIAHYGRGLGWQFLGFEVVGTKIFRIVKVDELCLLAHETCLDDQPHHKLKVTLVEPLTNANHWFTSVMTKHYDL